MRLTDKQFYNSKRWLRLRAAVLQRDGYECQLAKMQGKHEPAVTVHHIFPRSQFPEYQWCDWNLISLSLPAHNMMHVRDTDMLTERGELLRQETARKQGIDRDRDMIVIIGFPGTGKTTYAKRHIGNGIVYDLDAIAAALRLELPKVDDHKGARWMANELFNGFAQAASRFTRRVLIIRTAPRVEDLIGIDPTEIVICRGGYGNKDLTNERRQVIAQRIKDAEEWANRNGIKVTEVDHGY